jgi:phosphoribosylanthranilate isomerase
MTAVKICGLCTPEDAAQAATSGATYIGVILSAGHARSRTLDEAAAIFEAGASADPAARFTAAAVRRVGVFVDEPVREVLDAAQRLQLDVVQLHGSESSSAVAHIAAETEAEVWKAVRIRSAGDLDDAVRWYPRVDGMLLDGWSARAHGGVGAKFDWHALVRARAALSGALRVIVAGGLNAENVADVIGVLRPDVVDVSSGVERSVGVKSAAAVDAFVVAARAAATSHD